MQMCCSTQHYEAVIYKKNENIWPAEFTQHLEASKLHYRRTAKCNTRASV